VFKVSNRKNGTIKYLVTTPEIVFPIRTEHNRILILFKHIQLITITKLQNAWIIKYTYTV